MQHIVIIGNGISGITAARNIRKRSNNQVTVISAETDYFFSRTALMYVFMGHMKFEHTKPYEDWFWEKNKIKLLRTFVDSIDTNGRELHFSDGGSISYDVLILALGSKTNKFNWPGQELKGVQGLYSVQDLALMQENTPKVKNAVIVGGGLIGIEMAEMLISRGIHVTCLIREKGYWQNVLPIEESEFIGKHIRDHGVDLHCNTELDRIVGNANGRVERVLTSNHEEIECQFVGITTGVMPNIDLLKDTGIEYKNGILVDDYLQTNINDVYAVGDCAEMRIPQRNRRSIEPVWYTGRMMGEVVAHTVTGSKTSYKPGIWYNSAKFFDIEYQTYGTVLPLLKDGQDQFYWEDEGSRCLKIVFNKNSKIVNGINVFGVRLKHEVCDEWLQKDMTISEILEDFPRANFDPEFHPDYVSNIIQTFNQTGLGMVQLDIKNRGFLAKMFNLGS